MLKQLIQQLGQDLVAVVAIAVAVGIALVAAAFALYAGLVMVLAPAVASAATALVFGAIAGLVAVIVPRLGKSKAKASPRVRADPVVISAGLEVGMVVLGLVGDMLVRRRARQHAVRSAAPRRH